MTESPSPTPRTNLVIVSGLAGAGKTVVIDALEDIGFYCIDNLPSILFETFAEKILLGQFHARSVGVALDARDPNVAKAFVLFYERIKNQCDLDVVFLEAQEDVLFNRFKETRRVHPLSLAIETLESPLSLSQAIQADIRLLVPVRERAGRIIDTSEMSAHYLRHFIKKLFSSKISISSELQINLVSFGFKYGIPKDLDTIFDARCFANPHYIPHLRNLTGLQPEIKKYVFADGNVNIFINKIIDLVTFLFPLYSTEGKSYFALGVGCTGGKHRSVAIIEQLAIELRALTSRLTVEHRHFDRE